MSWSARQYVAFEDERTRPVRDLVAAIPNEIVRNAVDIGCGPGNSTEILLARYAGASITGLDSSDDMVDAARKRLPDVQFRVADIGAWDDPGPYDVISRESPSGNEDNRHFNEWLIGVKFHTAPYPTESALRQEYEGERERHVSAAPRARVGRR